MQNYVTLSTSHRVAAAISEQVEAFFGDNIE
jgi:hypothetical protein